MCVPMSRVMKIIAPARSHLFLRRPSRFQGRMFRQLLAIAGAMVPALLGAGSYASAAQPAPNASTALISSIFSAAPGE